MRRIDAIVPDKVDLWHQPIDGSSRFQCIGEGMTWLEATTIISERSGHYQIRFPKKVSQKDQQTLPLCE